MWYLTRWVVDDSDGLGDLTPEVGGAENFAAFDLRGEADRLIGNPSDEGGRGFAIVWSTDPIKTRRNRVMRLGDNLDDISVAARNQLQNRLGWTKQRPGENKLRDMLFEIALDEADDLDPKRPNRMQGNRAGWQELKVGGQIIGRQRVPSSLGAAYTDNFNRTDAVLTSESPQLWDTCAAGNSFEIESNVMKKNQAFGGHYNTYIGGQATGDAQYAEMVAVNSGSQQHGPQVRVLNSLANASGYMTWYDGFSLMRLRYTTTGNSRTTLTSVAGLSVTAPSLWRIEVDGSGLEGFLEGSSLSTTTDTTYPGASTRRSGGMLLVNDNQEADDWAFGDLGAAPQDISPTAIASGNSTTQPSLSSAISTSITPIASGNGTTQPSLTAGAADISPTAIDTGSSTTEPTLSPGAVTISPSPLVGDAATTTPSLTPGGVVASQTPIASGHSLTEPVVALDTTQILNPTPIGSGSQVTEPTASPGSVIIEPTPIATGWSATEPQVVVEGAAQLIYPTEIASGSSLTDPTAIVNQAVSPTPIAPSAAVTEPQVSVSQIINLTPIGSGHVIEWNDFFWIRNALVPTHPVNPVTVSGLKRGHRVFHE